MTVFASFRFNWFSTKGSIAFAKMKTVLRQNKIKYSVSRNDRDNDTIININSSDVRRATALIKKHKLGKNLV